MSSKPSMLILLRHGATDWNSVGKLNSFTDKSLSADGVLQVKNLASRIDRTQFSRIISSPLSRARETAEIIAVNRSIELDSRIVEVNFGPFEGYCAEEMQKAGLQKEFELWRDENAPLFPEGAESFSDAGKRAVSFMESVSRYEGVTLVISHGVLLRILVCECVLGIPASYYRRIRMDNGKLAVITGLDAKRPRLIKLNSDNI